MTVNADLFKLEAEEAVIGSLLINYDCIIDINEVGLTGPDFWLQSHQFIFEAMIKLINNNHGFDFLSLSDALERDDNLQKIGGAAHLTELLNVVPTHINAGHYAKIVKRKSIQRKMVSFAGMVAELAHKDSIETEDMIARVESGLLAITQVSVQNEPRHVSHFTELHREQAEKLQKSAGAIIGMPTGLSDLDKKLGGLQAGKLYILAGDPGMGKSATALQILNYTCSLGNRGLLFSLEMGGTEIIGRSIAQLSGIDSQLLHLEDNQYRALKAQDTIDKYDQHIDDETIFIEDIRSKAIAHKIKYGLDLLIVDYIQEIRSRAKFGSRNEMVGFIGREFKRIARELNLSVLALSSLSRQAAQRANHRPQRSDLRESGDLEFAADVVWFVYCDDVYNSDTDMPNIAEFIIDKNRSGKTGITSNHFNRATSKFSELTTQRVDFNYEQIR